MPIWSLCQNLSKRPLDKIRLLSIWWKIPINTLLLFIFFTYGSWTGEGHCLTTYDEECDYWYLELVLHNRNRLRVYSKSLCDVMYAAAVSIFLLALTSDIRFRVDPMDSRILAFAVFGLIFSKLFEFLGRISYTLYLIHERELFI